MYWGPDCLVCEQLQSWSYMQTAMLSRSLAWSSASPALDHTLGAWEQDREGQAGEGHGSYGTGKGEEQGALKARAAAG